MKTSFIIMTLLISSMNLSVSAQTEATQDSPAKEEILTSKVTRSQLQTGDFGEYFKYNYTNYAPNREIINELKNRIYGCDIIVVLGTWCSDSQREVPRFYKIMDKLEYNTNTVKVFCVDRNKTAGDIDISNLNIERIPTFIILKNGTEIGRIVESPDYTLEKDLLEIINN